MGREAKSPGRSQLECVTQPLDVTHNYYHFAATVGVGNEKACRVLRKTLWLPT
jgi:hypothetical protein